MIEVLKEIRKDLREIKEKEQLPRLIYPKEIVDKYPINLNKATDLCKKYGTNFGGYCIEAERFKEVLQAEGQNIFKKGVITNEKDI